MSPRVFVLAVVLLPSRRYPAHMLVASEADGTVAFLPHHPDLEVWAVPIDPATAPAPNTTAMRLTAFPVVMRSVKDAKLLATFLALFQRPPLIEFSPSPVNPDKRARSETPPWRAPTTQETPLTVPRATKRLTGLALYAARKYPTSIVLA